MNDDEYTPTFSELSVPSGEEEHDLVLSLHEAIAKLEPKDALIIALISSGYSRIEGSRIVGITRNAVGKRYSKAIRELKELLGGDSDIYAIP